LEQVIDLPAQGRWLIACPTSGRQATILSILLILSKNLCVLCACAVQIFYIFFRFLAFALPTGNNPVHPVDPV